MKMNLLFVALLLLVATVYGDITVKGSAIQFEHGTIVSTPEDGVYIDDSEDDKITVKRLRILRDQLAAAREHIQTLEGQVISLHQRLLVLEGK